MQCPASCEPMVSSLAFPVIRIQYLAFCWFLVIMLFGSVHKEYSEFLGDCICFEPTGARNTSALYGQQGWCVAYLEENPRLPQCEVCPKVSSTLTAFRNIPVAGLRLVQLHWWHQQCRPVYRLPPLSSRAALIRDTLCWKCMCPAFTSAPRFVAITDFALKLNQRW